VQPRQPAIDRPGGAVDYAHGVGGTAERTLYAASVMPMGGGKGRWTLSAGTGWRDAAAVSARAEAVSDSARAWPGFAF